MTAALQTRPIMTTSGDSGEAVFLLIKQHMNFHSYVKLLEAIYSGPEIYNNVAIEKHWKFMDTNGWYHLETEFDGCKKLTQVIVDSRAVFKRESCEL